MKQFSGFACFSKHLGSVKLAELIEEKGCVLPLYNCMKSLWVILAFKKNHDV